jgi:hypothetical protein
MKTVFGVARLKAAFAQARVFIAAALLGPALASPSMSIELPGGKASWVVSVGELANIADNNSTNWVRLGYYSFATDGTVSSTHWSWAMDKKPLRVDTPVYSLCTGSDVAVCNIKTVAGFLASPTGGFRGNFTYLPTGELRVTWTHDGASKPLAKALNETWALDVGLMGGTLARIRSATFYTAPDMPAPGQFSDYSANFGIGYGSNASLAYTSKATMSELRYDPRYSARAYNGRNVVVTKGAVVRQTSGGRWTFAEGVKGVPGNDPWSLCDNESCIAWRQHGSSCQCLGPDGKPVENKDRLRYIAEVVGGRRNTEWFWCDCLRKQTDACYQANSHVRPLLQVIDDNGEFHGWVGVEASTHVNPVTLEPMPSPENGFFSVFEMVRDELDNRPDK